MTLKDKLQLAWNNKGNIIDGFYNAYISSNDEIKKEAIRRLEICRSNKCGFHNPNGINNSTMKAVFPGKESCGGCGCDIYAKCHAMSANCYLKDVKYEPLWEAVMTNEQEQDVNKIAYNKQFENRK
jgi:hypothetical protein